MHSPGRHIWRALTGLIGLRHATARECHLAIEDDVRRVDRMRVVWIERMRAILPEINTAETFLPKLPFESASVHASVYPSPIWHTGRRALPDARRWL